MSRLLVVVAAAVGALACIATLAGIASAATASTSSERDIGTDLIVGASAVHFEVFQGVRVTSTNGKTTLFTGTRACIEESATPPPGDLFAQYTGCSRIPDSHYLLHGLPPKSLTISPSQVVVQRQCVDSNYATTTCSPNRTDTFSLRLTGLLPEGRNKSNDKQVDGKCTYVDDTDQLQYSNSDSNTSTNPYVVFNGAPDVSVGMVSG